MALQRGGLRRAPRLAGGRWIGEAERDGIAVLMGEDAAAGDGFGLPFLAAIPAAAAGIAAAASAAGAVGTTVASIVSAIVTESRKHESEAIKSARARGASPAEIRAIRRKWAKQRKAQVAAARRKGKGKGRKMPPKRARLTEEQRKAQALKAAAEFQRAAVIGSTTTDILHRIGLGVQEAAVGTSVDPWTGEAAVHPVVSAPPPPPEPWVSRPVLGPIPGWGIIAGGLVLVVGAVAAMGRR